MRPSDALEKRLRNRQHRMVRRTGMCMFVSFLLLAVGCNPQARTGTEPPTTDYSIRVAGKTIRLARSDWKQMENPTDYAENFESLSQKPRREYQLVTVFKLPMSIDRRLGVRISRNEYLEAFVTEPRAVTIQLRLDRGAYWVLSREKFRVDPAEVLHSMRAKLNSLSAHLTEEETLWVFSSLLQAEIDSTRYMVLRLFEETYHAQQPVPAALEPGRAEPKKTMIPELAECRKHLRSLAQVFDLESLTYSLEYLSRMPDKELLKSSIILNDCMMRDLPLTRREHRMAYWVADALQGELDARQRKREQQRE